MAIGYLLGGLFCLAYMALVGYFGGLKHTPWILKQVKLKLGKKMTDDRAAKIALIFSALMGAVGIFLLIFGATR
jgi:hypothetical protein